MAADGPVRGPARPAGGAGRAASARSRHRAETRRRIVDAGARAFGRYGFHGAKIAAVAREAGVANGTFYLHFKDKDELFHEVARAATLALAARLRAIEAQDLDPTTSERRELEAIVDFAAEHGDLMRAGLARALHGSRASMTAMELLVRQRAAALARGIERGVVSPCIDPEVAARADFGMLTAVLEWWSSRGGAVSRERLVETLSALRRGGLGLPAAREGLR